MSSENFSLYEEKVTKLFFDRVNRGEKISDPRKLPSVCRKLLEKTILMNFFAEWWGGVNYFRCLDIVPNSAEQQYMEVIAREEMGHAHILEKGSLAILELDPYATLAKNVKEQKGLLQVFKYPEILSRSWGDVVIFNRLQDASADMQLDEFADGFFKPYCNDIDLIEAEEVGHVEHANRSIREYIKMEKTRGSKCPSMYYLQRALDFWLPLVLDVFGKPNGKNENLYLKYKLKHRTNEESRKLFISRIAPFFQEIGLSHPLLIV